MSRSSGYSQSASLLVKEPVIYQCTLGIFLCLICRKDYESTYQKKGEKIMSRVLVIGCGGVASVAIQKCCQADEVFTELCIASRTKEKCDALVEKLKGKTKTVLTTAKVDADDVNQLIELINQL